MHFNAKKIAIFLLNFQVGLCLNAASYTQRAYNRYPSLPVRVLRIARPTPAVVAPAHPYNTSSYRSVQSFQGSYAIPQFAPGLARWPTDNFAFHQGRSKSAYIQPTQSGRILSGQYGCVRNQGKRFHAALDMKSIFRDAQNIPHDKIYAVLPGVVVYINRDAQRSNYGKHVVLLHQDQAGIVYYTLYAHLASVTPHLRIKQFVHQSDVLGIMGYTGNVPGLSHAHVHFEIGQLVGNRATFTQWFTAQNFSNANYHNVWRQFQRIPLDPLRFYQSKTSFTNFLKSEPVAFTLAIATQNTPEFFVRNPGLGSLYSPQSYGWQIDFNWVGAILAFRPLMYPLHRSWAVVRYNYSELTRHGNRHTLEFDPNGRPFIGKILRKELLKLFGKSFY